MSVWYRVRDLDAARAFYRDGSDSRSATSTRRPLGAARARRHGDRARGGRSRDEGGVALDRRRGRPGRGRAAAGGGRRGRRRARAARRDADRRRLRPRREPHPAAEEVVVIRPAGPQDVPFLRDMLRHAYYGAPGLRGRGAAGALRQRLGPRGDAALVAIDGANRSAPRGTGCSRGTSPGSATSTTRRRSWRSRSCRAGAGEGIGDAAPRRAGRPRARGGLRADQPQRRGGQPGGPALRAARLREGSASRPLVDALRALEPRGGSATAG